MRVLIRCGYGLGALLAFGAAEAGAQSAQDNIEKIIGSMAVANAQCTAQSQQLVNELNRVKAELAEAKKVVPGVPPAAAPDAPK